MLCYYGNIAEVKMANKERNAEGYIRNHKILELFENLTAQLIFERPGEYSLRLLLNVFLSHFSWVK